MKALSLAALLLLASTGAAAQVYKCTNAQGKVEISDTLCAAGTAAERIANRRDSRPVSDGHIQDSLARVELQREQQGLKCEAARESVRHNNTSLNRTVMRQECGLPEPAPRQATRTYCSGTSQQYGNQTHGSANCISR